MRIAIAGGSVGGLFAAALLHQAGHDVRVFERSKRGLAGRGAGLVPQADVFEILRAVGRPEVAASGVAASARITLDRSGRVLINDPHPQIQISWDALYLAMRSAVPDDAYRLGASVAEAGQSADHAWLRLDDGSRVEADLVIGADGIGSAVRRAMRDGSMPVARYAGYVAWRFLLPEAVLPPVSAGILSGRFAFYHMPGGQVLGYLVAGAGGDTTPGGRRYNCVWYRRVDDLPELLIDRDGVRHPFSLPPGAVPDSVRARLIIDAQELLPPSFAVVVASEMRPFVQAIFDMEAPVMQEGRLALLGDAAFVVRPHTAMGVAKAAGDAMALAHAVGTQPLPQALADYDHSRRPIGHAIYEYGRRLGKSLE